MTTADPDQVARTLTDLAAQLRYERDAGAEIHQTLAEQAAYRRGFSRALALLASAGFKVMMDAG